MQCNGTESIASTQVWDLDKSTLDPYIKHAFDRKNVSRVQFGRNAPVLLTGSTDGSVDLFRLFGIEDRSTWSREEQANALRETIRINSENKEAKKEDEEKEPQAAGGH